MFSRISRIFFFSNFLISRHFSFRSWRHSFWTTESWTWWSKQRQNDRLQYNHSKSICSWRLSSRSIPSRLGYHRRPTSSPRSRSFPNGRHKLARGRRSHSTQSQYRKNPSNYRRIIRRSLVSLKSRRIKAFKYVKGFQKKRRYFRPIIWRNRFHVFLWLVIRQNKRLNVTTHCVKSHIFVQKMNFDKISQII